MELDTELTYEHDDVYKIRSISEYINTISSIRKKIIDTGESSLLFFRGQSNSLWDVRPSIYRDSLVSVEDEIIQKAISRVPDEFYQSSPFDILTKLQHYGLPTRLLDVTMNPLVALYFACCSKEYINIGREQKEADGMVFYSSAYAENVTEQQVIILSSIAKLKIDGKSTLQWLKDKLSITTLKDKNKFITLLQGYSFVMPSYSNSRIISQSGAFLLSGAINIYEDNENIWNSKVEKSNCSLKNAFTADPIIIDAEAKDSILDELDFLNINEGSLFPELEHQMSHVKRIGAKNIQEIIPEFIKYEMQDLNPQNDTSDEKIRRINKDDIEHIIGKYVKVKSLSDNILQEILKAQEYPDWYKKDTTKSSLRNSIKRILIEKKKKKAKDIAFSIVQDLINKIR